MTKKVKYTKETSQKYIVALCDELTKDLKEVNLEMVKAIYLEDYETAAKNRDQISHLLKIGQLLIEENTDLEEDDIENSLAKLNNHIFILAQEHFDEMKK
jgi:hypothetical protein